MIIKKITEVEIDVDDDGCPVEVQWVDMTSYYTLLEGSILKDSPANSVTVKDTYIYPDGEVYTHSYDITREGLQNNVWK